MTTWHIRLSRRKMKKNQIQTYMREHFACEHSLIIISYGVRMNITNLSHSALVNHVRQTYLNRPDVNSNSITKYVTQIERFRDGISTNDIVISPFYKLADGKRRIGIINSEYKPLEDFFGNQFSNVINSHVNTHGVDYFIDQNKNVVDEHRHLPAREVKWLTGFVDNSFLEKEISTEIKNKSAFGTTIMIKCMPH